MAYYYGRDPRSRSIKHWKYKRKVKVNGKWKYYYDDAAYNPKNETVYKKVDGTLYRKQGADNKYGEYTSPDGTKMTYKKGEGLTGESTTFRVSGSISTPEGGVGFNGKTVKATDGKIDRAKDYVKSLFDSKTTYTKTTMNGIETHVLYKKGKISQTVDKGANTISNTLDKGKATLIKNVNKGKKWLSKLFK